MGNIDFEIERQIDEIARHRDMIRRLRLHIINESVQHGSVHRIFAIAQPVDIAGDTLRCQFAISHARQRRKVYIGDMGETKHKAHLLDNA